MIFNERGPVDRNVVESPGLRTRGLIPGPGDYSIDIGIKYVLS